MDSSLIRYVHYIPILTTIISALFSISILMRYLTKKEAFYLLWWGIGVAVYGAGTLVESYHTLMGWSELNFKLWYIFGALLGGAPLAIGSIYLLLGKKAGHVSVIILTVTVSILSVFVFLSPIKSELINQNVLNSNVLEWQDIRKVSPFINGLAAIFLIGGAIYSAMNYRKKPEMRNRFIGNIYIAIGAVLPGIGGGFSRAGFTEALYIGEFIGIILIWYGYVYCRREDLVVNVVMET